MAPSPQGGNVLFAEASSLLGEHRTFRDGQFEAIEALVEKRSRILVVQRTGWGKSSVYFIATKLLRDRGLGPTLIISPLLALMRNQVAEAAKAGLRIHRIDSTNREDWDNVHAAISRNEVDALLVSPERLAAESFIEMLLGISDNFGMLVIDEAHCISDWGHDFRPDYRRILRIVQKLPKNVPVLATTATANSRVVKDIEEQVGGGMKTLRGSLRRDTLHLFAAPQAPADARMAWMAEAIPKLGGSGIIYVQSKQDGRRLARWLSQHGVMAEAYSADSPNREELEDKLLNNKVTALVATVALGMGFHKDDLHFVIHFQRPKSLIEYYQQVGRAGRSIDKAWGIMLSGSEDGRIGSYFIEAGMPDRNLVNEILETLTRASNGLATEALDAEVNAPSRAIEATLRLIAVEAPAPVRHTDGRWFRTAVPLKMDWSRFESLRTLRYDEQKRVVEYSTSDSCLMTFLSSELDDNDASACGKCGPCKKHQFDFNPSQHLVDHANKYLANADTYIPALVHVPYALRSEFGTTIPAELRHQGGRALCCWGDEPFGLLVKEGKETGRFSQQLIRESVELIRSRWTPKPPVTWVTAVPSRRHQTLVPGLARSLAAELNLPFVECIKKPRETAAQKTMQNRTQQARNALNSFKLAKAKLPSGPVLLVDDLTDSGWTFMAISMLLRRAGCPGVYPFALAKANRQDTIE